MSLKLKHIGWDFSLKCSSICPLTNREQKHSKHVKQIQFSLAFEHFWHGAYASINSFRGFVFISSKCGQNGRGTTANGVGWSSISIDNWTWFKSSRHEFAPLVAVSRSALAELALGVWVFMFEFSFSRLIGVLIVVWIVSYKRIRNKPKKI